MLTIRIIRSYCWCYPLFYYYFVFLSLYNNVISVFFSNFAPNTEKTQPCKTSPYLDQEPKLPIGKQHIELPLSVKKVWSPVETSDESIEQQIISREQKAKLRQQIESLENVVVPKSRHARSTSCINRL